MVNKLIKYEFKAFAKVMLPIYLVLLGIAALYRILVIFSNGSLGFSIVNTSAIIVYGIAIAACIFMTVIMSIVRYYSNLFTSEGYLSFTLPVSSEAHLLSKLTVSLIFDVITIGVVLLSYVVATAGQVLAEVIKAAAYTIRHVLTVVGGQSPIFIIEGIIFIFATLVMTHLLFYMCISIGQLVPRHKILMAVGVYFAYYVLTQTVETILVLVATVGGLGERMALLFAEHPFETVHILLCGMIAVYAILSVVYFIVSNLLVKKKLNLE